jgi:hypothetical protein
LAQVSDQPQEVGEQVMNDIEALYRPACASGPELAEFVRRLNESTERGAFSADALLEVGFVRGSAALRSGALGPNLGGRPSPPISENTVLKALIRTVGIQ